MAKAEKLYCNNQWTEAKKNAFIKSALRSASNRWAPKHLVIKQARIARNTYVCAICKNKVGHKSIKADHINPVVPLSGFTNWDDYIKRMFVEVDGYQAICKDCHAKKTKEENAERKKNKNLTPASEQLELAIERIDERRIKPPGGFETFP